MERVGLAEPEETVVKNWGESGTLMCNSRILLGSRSICHAVLSSSFLKLFTLCILNQYFRLIYQLNAPTVYVTSQSLHCHMFWHDSAIFYYNKIENSHILSV
jgi:hypothetical protein